MSLTAPERIWWKPVGRDERLWVGTAVVFLLVLFASMPLWHVVASQNTPRESYRVDEARYQQIVDDFVARYQVGTEGALPVVQPPPGDIYLQARQFLWTPILVLQAGETYRLHLSSTDVQHGFSIQPLNMNFQVVPGYDLVLRLIPQEPGEYTVICNQFCGLGHHLMSGKIIVGE